ncbi:LysM peptidoglycan-binding domain-containing protein [Acidithrix sp. C25]|uniref:LysM peptidoglycan-binding domain-containing protein n=1 Tax=Acidithrix sp. C25 TaxID=1671482 RepID=UPI00191BC7D8|nr:LysM peptidoglycan-binding domain-containing protein [Acidithrix sp. C25]
MLSSENSASGYLDTTKYGIDRSAIPPRIRSDVYLYEGDNMSHSQMSFGSYLKDRPNYRAVYASSAVALHAKTRTAKDDRLSLSETMKGAILVGFVLLSLCLSLYFSSMGVPSKIALASVRHYVVQPGDTVWTISQRFANGQSVFSVEERILAKLGTTTIYPGEVIAIP